MSINSFADIERYYMHTKPVVSKHHTLEDDVRPVSERRRKWERIVKVNKNQYAILSGHTEHVLSALDSTQEQRNAIVRMAIKTAPILWTRKPDGTEELRLRNIPYGGSPSFNAFMWRNTPMHFRYYAQRMSTPIGVFNLPTVEYSQYKIDRLRADPSLATNRYFGNPRRTIDTDKNLTFRVVPKKLYADEPYRNEYTYELLGTEPKRVVTSKQVLTKAKRKYVSHIKTLRSYIESMAMLFAQPPKFWGDDATRNAYREATVHSATMLGELAQERGIEIRWHHNLQACVTKVKLAQYLVTQPDRQEYYNYAYGVWLETSGYEVSDERELKNWRGRFNNYMNTTLGLTKTIERKV